MRGATRKGRPWLALLGLCAVALAASSSLQCADVTQLVVVVDTDLEVGTAIDRVDVRVEGPGGFVSTDGRPLTVAEPRVTLGVVAGEDPSAAVTITATATLRGQPVTRTIVKARMTPGESRLVHVSLCRSCGAECSWDRGDRLDPFTGELPPRSSCEAPADGGVDASGPRCPEDMALVSLSTGDAFCIDRTEVSQADYAEFLDATGGDAGARAQPDVCAFNTSFRQAESFEAGQCEGDWFKPDETPTLPMSCIDWCDAWAFCDYKGKRLCGAVGGGALSRTDLFNAQVDEWFAACSDEGGRAFPYGNDYDPARCNGSDRPGASGGLWPVGSEDSCRGGKGEQLFDMIGNVGELVDACEHDPSTSDDQQYCAFRGGGRVVSERLHLRCNASPDPTRLYQRIRRRFGADDIGVRCCADALSP